MLFWQVKMAVSMCFRSSITISEFLYYPLVPTTSLGHFFDSYACNNIDINCHKIYFGFITIKGVNNHQSCDDWSWDGIGQHTPAACIVWWKMEKLGIFFLGEHFKQNNKKVFSGKKQLKESLPLNFGC